MGAKGPLIIFGIILIFIGLLVALVNPLFGIVIILCGIAIVILALIAILGLLLAGWLPAMLAADGDWMARAVELMQSLLAKVQRAMSEGWDQGRFRREIKAELLELLRLLRDNLEEILRQFPMGGMAGRLIRSLLESALNEAIDGVEQW